MTWRKEVGTVGPIIVILVVLAVLAKNQNLLGKLKGGSDKLGLSDPRILIALGLVVFNLISWAMIPWWWDVLTYTWYSFVVFNVGFWVVLYLRTVKTKDAAGKDTKEDHPTASKLASIIAVVLVVGLVTTAYKVFSGKPSSSSIISRTPAGTNLSHSAPMEIAKLVICGCESNCQQFDPSTKTPLKNKERVSTAFGKYQFLESHREPARKLGFDLNTEEGQDGYFEHLYAESSTKHWEADSRSVACWEPKLRAYTWGGEAVSLVVRAPINEWSKPPIPLTHKGETADLSGLGKKYTVRWNEDRSDQVDEDLPRAAGVAPKNPAVAYSFRLKSRESEPVNVLVKLY